MNNLNEILEALAKYVIYKIMDIDQKGK